MLQEMLDKKLQYSVRLNKLVKKIPILSETVAFNIDKEQMSIHQPQMIGIMTIQTTKRIPTLIHM